MRLATLRGDFGTRAIRIDGTDAIELAGYADVGEVLRKDALGTVAQRRGSPIKFNESQLAPVIPAPGKILCVGLNYRNHIREMGREIPSHPTVFTKFQESLIGPRDVIALPPESTMVDWEGELAVVLGRTVRRVGRAGAESAIGGYTVFNDVTVRDWQYRTTQWFQGKAWEASTPLGPFLVTPDEIPQDAKLTTAVDGRTVQSTAVDDLVFGAADLISYISTFVTLNAGDIIATGTPGGVGHASTPPRYLRDGQTLTTTIDGIGTLINPVVAEALL